MIRIAAVIALASALAAADLTVEHPWSRATAAGAETGAVYATLRNAGAADTLLSAESPAAATVEVHEHLMSADGMMQMRAVQGGVAIPAGGAVEFKPHGYHVMLIGLKEPLKQGATVAVTFVFAKAGRVTAQAVVNGAGAMSWDEK